MEVKNFSLTLMNYLKEQIKNNGFIENSELQFCISELAKEGFKKTVPSKEEVEKITSTDDFKAQMAILAKQIVDEIIEETHKKTVEEISNRLAALSTGCGGYTLRDMIEQTVADMMNR